MPIVESSYSAPWWLRNGHLHTVYAALRRRVDGIRYVRERLELDDGDFLDLDWSRVGSQRQAVVVSHGLEGSSNAAYVKGMVRAFNLRGWDAVAWNQRGCSGEPNRLLRLYHSGVSDDLLRVAGHVAGLGYERVGLVGFSLGGNVTLKLAGEMGSAAPAWMTGAVGISVPVDLAGSSASMERPENRIYMGRFLGSLRGKLRAKQARFPEAMDDSGYGAIRSFRGFDGRYTAPIHGFASAEDYWAKSGALRVLDGIRFPVLLLNSRDDPFLSPGCFPTDVAREHGFLHLEVPRHGGHVGFMDGGGTMEESFAEKAAVEFLAKSLDAAGKEKEAAAS